MALLDLDDPYRAPTIAGASGGGTSSQGRSRTRAASASPYASTQQPTGFQPSTAPSPDQAPSGWPPIDLEAVFGNNPSYSVFNRTPQTASGTPSRTAQTTTQPQTMDWASIFSRLFNPTIAPPSGPGDPTPQPPASPFQGTQGLVPFMQGRGAPSYDNFRSTIEAAIQAGHLPPGTSVLDHPSKLDKVRLPNGQVLDLVVGAGGGNPSWGYMEDSGGGMFDNPLLSQFTNLGQYGIDQLLQPQGIHPVLQQALDALTGIMGARDPGYEAFTGIANKRLAQLDQPAYTDAQRALLTTNFTEPIEAQRGARKQQALERASARGMAPSSGLLELDTRDIDRSFDQVLGEGRRQLGVNEIAANESRQQEAVQIGQLLASLSGKNLPLQLSAAGQMGSIGSNLQNEPTNRLLQALGISGQMSQLPFQSLAANQSLFNSINSAPVPQADPTSSLITALLALAQGGTNAGNQAAGQDQNFWASLFSALPGLFGSIPGMAPSNQARPRTV